MRRVFVAAAMLFALAACKEADPVRAAVDDVAEAAESRDVGDVMEHVAATYPGRQEVEQYSDPNRLLRRSADIQETLRADGWQPLG